MAKKRTHNEFFRAVMPRRKSCPNCRAKLEEGERVWCWGSYVRIRWVNVVGGFCKACYDETVKARLDSHTGACGCTVELRGYQGQELPAWLR
jgi:hypothetical protein